MLIREVVILFLNLVYIEMLYWLLTSFSISYMNLVQKLNQRNLIVISRFN